MRTTFIALLRSINVGGRNKVPMADLRALVGSLGFSDVATYVQSGNVVFTGPGTADAASASIAGALADRLGVAVPVLVRTDHHWAGVLSASPYRAMALEPTTVHVTFLDRPPGSDAVHRLESDAERFAPDRLQLIGAEVHLHCPGGYGETKLNNAFVEGRLGVTATTRNWRTVTALAEMAGVGVG